MTVGARFSVCWTGFHWHVMFIRLRKDRLGCVGLNMVQIRAILVSPTSALALLSQRSVCFVRG
jgi:hypothetical protein